TRASWHTAASPAGDRVFVEGPFGKQDQSWAVLVERSTGWALRYLPLRPSVDFPLTAATTATFSPDGALLLAASADGGSIVCREAGSGKRIWSRPGRETAPRP